jgi:site-specific recombinase XerD
MLTRYQHHLIAGGRALGTVERRMLHIEHLRRVHPDLLTVCEDDLKAYLAARRMQAAETRKSIRSSFQSFYHWAHKQGLTPTDPAADLDPIHVPRTIARIAPDADVQTALITATLEQRTMILLARFGCLRLTELTTLRTDARQGDILHIIGKGEKHRLVPVNDELLLVLMQLERQNGPGYYFPGRYGAHMHPTAVGKIITRTTGWNPHSLRHAGATAAYNATGDLRAVQELLGHASLATTQRYLHTDLNKVRAAAAATRFLSPVDSPHFSRLAA